MSDFQVIAANDLRSGLVVYLTEEGDWSTDFQRAAHLISDAKVQVAEQQSAVAVHANNVIDPYLVKVTQLDAAPSHIRERIRFSGPTCLPGEQGSAVKQIA